MVNLGLTLDQAYEENCLLKDMLVKHGLTGGYDTPRRDKGHVPRPPKTAGSMQWSEFGAPSKHFYTLYFYKFYIG